MQQYCQWWVGAGVGLWSWAGFLYPIPVVKAAEMSLSQAQPPLEALLQEGRKRVETGDFASALHLYQQAAALDASNARIFSAIGYLQLARETLALQQPLTGRRSPWRGRIPTSIMPSATVSPTWRIMPEPPRLTSEPPNWIRNLLPLTRV